MPWGKTIPFDVFCEEILPYRVSTEPLENWREKVLASFADLYKSFRDDTTLTAIEACTQVNDKLPRFRIDKDFPPMSYSQIMASTRGPCDRISDFAVFVMRGLGIPVTFESTPQWVGLPNGHSWNSVRDSSGVHISFACADANPGQSHQGNTFIKVKVYRQMYAEQQNVNLEKENVPPLLQHINCVLDVTAEYEDCREIRFPGSDSHSLKTETVFLAIPLEMNWYPVGWGNLDADGFQFQSVAVGLYLPVYYHNYTQTPAHYPFRLDEDGNCRFFIPDSLCKESLVLTQINQPSPGDNQFIGRMLNGRFEGANHSDFSDAQLLYTITEITGAFYHSAEIRHQTSKYRYVRYVSPANGYCNVAELEFYDENDNKLRGTVIGTSRTWENSNMTCDKAFDGDIDTYFDAAEGHSWAGLDLKEPRRIAKLRYLPRTVGNSIYEGCVYELFYWNGKEWDSLGRQTATSHLLQYQAPANALLVLKNVTKNKMYKTPFIMENGAQQWFDSN